MGDHLRLNPTSLFANKQVHYIQRLPPTEGRNGSKKKDKSK